MSDDYVSFLFQSKYIKTLMGKAEERKRQHDVIFEKNLAKERSKEDHLFADKDKFVTAAYKRKLAEQEKWMEEERLRELREQKDDVCITFSAPNLILLHIVIAWSSLDIISSLN